MTIDKKTVLKARAKQLSKIEQFDNVGKESSIEVVEFTIFSETFALESSCIREVYPVKDYTPLPCTPPFIIGLINVRRKVLSLIDLCHFFGRPKMQEIVGKKALILEQGDMEFGILADDVTNVSKIVLTDIQPALPTLTKVRQEFLQGVTSQGLIILNANKLFNYQPLIVNEEP